MTFSIAALCQQTGQLGVAVTSSSICVAARCAFVRSGRGAALSQNVTDPSLGTYMLDRCDNGMSAQEALDAAVASTPHAVHRQLALIDATGTTASYTGEKALGIHAAAAGRDCISVGNLLDNPEVPVAMAEHFSASSGELGERLIEALIAGQAAGGEAGPVKSVGLLVASDVSWPTVDLRIDWLDNDALPAMRDLWERYQPQAADYRTRALDPSDAPSYGVPGDL